MADPTTLRLLHGMRLGGVVHSSGLAERSDLPLDVLEPALDVVRRAGWARTVEGSHLSGWTLTAAGRVEGERLLADELDATGGRELVMAAHEEFVPLNVRLLEVCTAWQVVRIEGVEMPNDHSDEARDIWVLERLAHLHAEARPVLRRIADVLERFGGYERRLGHALERTLSGNSEWFTRPGIDSYHTVWFELHEDLLATLGLSRNAEVSRDGSYCGSRP
jgi:hypothetical protein